MRLRQAFVFILIGTGSAVAWAKQPAISIDGASEVLAGNIRSHLSLSGENCETPAWRLQALLQQADAEIREAGQALGYYQLRAEKRFISGPRCWELHLKIEPGPPVTVEKIHIGINGEGQADPAFRALPPGLVIRPGERLDHGKYEAIKKHLSTLALTRGYFDAAFTRTQLLVDTSANNARIEIDYTTGPRYRFGAITVDQSILSPELINRYIDFVPGEAYDSSKLIDLQQALSSNYFSRVYVRPLPEQSVDRQVPIEIEMVPLKQHSFTMGAGYGTDTGPRVKFDYENRYLNPAGHRFNTGLSISPRQSEFLAGYTIPLRSPQHENLKYFAGHVDEETETAVSAISSLGTHYSFLNDADWLQTWSLNFQREDFTVSEVRDRTDLLLPGLSFAKTHSSESTYPLYGWRLNASVQGASEDVFSDISLLQLQAKARYIHALGRGRLLLHTEGGATRVSEFDALPASLRFFAGGDTSIRGYDYQSLGPIGPDGDVIGGKRLLTGGLEYDHRILQQWALALFYDAGNAFNKRADYESKHGAGLGLRWLSPIGPIRLDFAKALDDAREWRIHINMGPDL
ncbi:MAG TPA: autotransporter assembly complex family protein [Gammaproteobacteria bacterium]|nr:autotransporter assembly complex family protein [Gammaproteobacteria bacterium]